MSARIIEVIVVDNITRGSEATGDLRQAIEFYTKEGTFLADIDPVENVQTLKVKLEQTKKELDEAVEHILELERFEEELCSCEISDDVGDFSYDEENPWDDTPWTEEEVKEDAVVTQLIEQLEAAQNQIDKLLVAHSELALKYTNLKKKYDEVTSPTEAMD